MFNEFVTPEILATFAGLVAVTCLIVQFTKFMLKGKLKGVSTRIYAFIIALILTFVFARNGNGVQGIVLTIINAILIAITSMGGYEVISDPKAQKQKVIK